MCQILGGGSCLVDYRLVAKDLIADKGEDASNQMAFFVLAAKRVVEEVSKPHIEAAIAKQSKAEKKK